MGKKQIFFFFEGNKPHSRARKPHSRARNEVDKVVIVGGSNNEGVWGQSSKPAEVNGG